MTFKQGISTLNLNRSSGPVPLTSQTTGLLDNPSMLLTNLVLLDIISGGQVRVSEQRRCPTGYLNLMDGRQKRKEDNMWMNIKDK